MAHIQDLVAQLWTPYDLYIGDEWSHRGVDTFTLMKSEGHWRVAALIYTIRAAACMSASAGLDRRCGDQRRLKRFDHGQAPSAKLPKHGSRFSGSGGCTSGVSGTAKRCGVLRA